MLDEESKMKNEWEKTRAQTFFLINIQLTKKSKIEYEKFKRDIWPFPWERQKKKTSEEGVMEVDQWQNIFNKQVISSVPMDLKGGIKS
jgi:hypothetical protein